MVSGKGIEDDCPLYEPRISDLTLQTKMVFLRKYMAAIFLQFAFTSAVCTLVILSPMARFYITENVWILFLLFFLFCSSYLSLVHFTKLFVAKLTLMVHVLVEAFTIGVLVIYYDWMFLYQGILLSTFCFLGLFFYTLQSKFDFGLCVTFVVYIGCSFCFSTILKMMFGGNHQEQILWMLVASLVLIYHGFFIAFFLEKLTPDDLLCALVNAHTLPINSCVYSSPIHKPLK